MPTIEDLIEAEHPRITEIRHDLHAHPELGYTEVRTSGVVKRELTDAGIEHVGGLAKGTGVLGYLPATRPNAKTVALRADMDALPIEEQTGVPYSSTHKGIMHACGHDGHTSIMIGTARALSKLEDRPNNLLFIFQPAEEGGAGGRAMCEDGALEGRVLGPKADIIFGLHGYSGLPVGKVSTRTGAMMASADEFRIHVHGRGGHAAMPHSGIDPIVVASHIVVALQTIASRNVDPLDSIVVTVGEFHGGTAHNIIPNTVELHGTLRTLKAETRAFGEKRVNELATSIAAGFGAKAVVEFLGGYPVTCNDAGAADRFRRVATETANVELAPDTMPTMGAEDFSFYGAYVPACFYWLGIVPPGRDSYPNLHAPDFDFNDDALRVGMRAMAALALSAD